MKLTPTHLHLLLNHFPSIGFIIGLALFAVATALRSQPIRLASLAVLVAISFIAVPTYVTGSAAAQAICLPSNVPGPCPDGMTSRSLIDQHEGAALAALAVMVATGGIAWLALWQSRRFGSIARWTQTVLLLMGLVTLALVSRAAALGGEIGIRKYG